MGDGFPIPTPINQVGFFVVGIRQKDGAHLHYSPLANQVT